MSDLWGVDQDPEEPVHQLPTAEVAQYRISDPSSHSYGGDERFNWEWLHDDISRNGVHNPVTIYTDGDRAHLDDGNHRATIAHEVGMPHIPARIVRLSPEDYDGYADDHQGLPGGTRIVGPAVRSVLSPHTAAIEADVAEDVARLAARPRRFTQDWQQVGYDLMPVEAVAHYMQRKETGFGDEKRELYELNRQPPLSEQVKNNGYEKAVHLVTDGRSGSIYDGHHRIDIARQLGHTHIPVEVSWRTPNPDGSPMFGDSRIEPWLKGWLTDMRRGRETVGAHTAMPNPLPQGVHFRYHPELMWSPGVTAHYQGQQIGSLEWYDDDHVMVDLGSRRPGEIDRISVHPDHRGNSVASSMFDFAKQYEPRLHHSEQLTDDGRGWSEYEKSRHARLAMPTYYHHTRDPDFKIDPERKPDNAVLNRELPGGGKGLFVSPDKDRWRNYHYRGRRPYLVELYSEEDLGDNPAELFISGDQLNNLQVKSVERKSHRLAMAWQDWAPKIEHDDYGSAVCNGKCDYDQENASGYKINHEYGQSGITYGHYKDERGNPFIGIIGLLTDDDHRNDGVAEALVRRLHQDHPGVRIDPGWMTDMGQGFHDRMLQKEPSAKDVVTAARLAMAWDEWAPKIRGGCSGGGCELGSEGRYVVPQAGAFMDYAHRAINGIPTIHILSIYTHPSDRGSGVAEAMVRRLVEEHPGHAVNPGTMTSDGQKFHDRMLDKDPKNRDIVTAGRNGDPPPMTFEPFNTMWTNGIMARHAHDGRPLAHLHWYPDGEIETIRVHPEMRGRGVGKAILTHAAMNPETYEAQGGIKPSNHLTADGRAFAKSMGHVPSDEEVTPAEGEHDWAWKAVQNYVPMHVPYNGQNEDEMSRYLEQPWEPPNRTASVDEGWPVWWRNRHRPAGPFDKRWHPNHPEHVPAPWADQDL